MEAIQLKRQKNHFFNWEFAYLKIPESYFDLSLYTYLKIVCQKNQPLAY